MNIFEKILYFLQIEMEEPQAYGWFHLLWIFLTISMIIFLILKKAKNKEKQLKIVLGVYGFGSLFLEIIKQLIWSFNYDPVTNIVTWDYQWYAYPFQLCTTPIFVSIICFFLKDGKWRNSLLSYMAFVTILGGITTIFFPDSCLVSDIMVNIHTMYLHCGSVVVSIFLLISGNIKINIQNFYRAFFIFLFFVLIAQILNISIYHSGLLNGEEFNMFYISPYFISTLPVFNIIQEKMPYLIFLLFYISAIFISSFLVYYISSSIQNFSKTKKRLS